jgi:FlaA1/EpsC-like NDP-sugar epimerase
MLNGKGVLITGGSGSLAQVLLRRLLSGEIGVPDRIRLFSRDEAKQHDIRLAYQHRTVATDEVIYHNYDHLVQFQIGDVRDRESIRTALNGIDIVFHAAAMKQVPTCEYFPWEAVRTNVGGAENLLHAIRTLPNAVETVVGISTDKACSPVNVMGMTKALQERVLIRGNLDCPDALHLRSLRQCHSVPRLGRAALRRADPQRWAGYGDDGGDDTLPVESRRSRRCHLRGSWLGAAR